MSEVVSCARRGGVAVISVDFPPVNALNVKVRAGLIEQVKAAQADADVKAMVLSCAGRTFIAGADITEFGKAPLSPSLDEMIAALEGATKPIVAAIHGTALGGGLETALACNYRVAVDSARVGLPEVGLGIIPGAGGTQRLPRLAGVEAALEMITGGAPIAAGKALKLGILDAIIEGDLVDGAVAFAEKVVAEGAKLVRVRDKECSASPAVFEGARALLAKKARGFRAPQAAVDAVEAATKLPFEAGVKREQELFMELLNGEQSAAQRYLFFAEREVQKLPDIPKDTPLRRLEKVGIIGSGTMGGGIAMALANTGMPVVLVDAKQEFLDRGMETIRKNYAISLERGRFTQEQVDERLGLITATVDYKGLADVDLVIEAVYEEMGVKHEVFAKLDEVCRPDALLASNTSTLSVDEIAAATKHPERVLGLHFFSPANIMKLVEIVRGKQTAPDVVATAMAFTKRVKKVGVVVGVCFGFVGNRMLFNYTREADFLLEEGASPEQVDGVIFDFGMPMGPLSMLDLSGLDITYRIRQGTPRPQGVRLSEVNTKLVEAGRLGQKSGSGYFKYEGRNRVADEEAHRLIREAASEAGIEQRDISDDEIVHRCIYPLINEGFKILDEGIALRPQDIDVIWIYGYGFPRYRGGPMHYAETVGLDKVLATLKELQKVHGDVMKPAPLLEKLVAEGTPLSSWKRA